MEVSPLRPAERRNGLAPSMLRCKPFFAAPCLAGKTYPLSARNRPERKS
jgi:hypothetical protein